MSTKNPYEDFFPLAKEGRGRRTELRGTSREPIIDQTAEEMYLGQREPRWESESMSGEQELARRARDFHAEEEAEKPEMERPRRGTTSGGKDLVGVGGRGSRSEKPPAPFQSKSTESLSVVPDTEREGKNREEFERIKKEFDENEGKIAESRYKAKSRWKVIKETLGFSKQMLEDDTVKEYVGRRKELYQKLMDSGRKTLRGNEQEYEEFMVRYDQETVAINSRTLETDIRAKNAKWSEKALIGFANVSKNYREFISKQFLNEKGKLSAKGIFKGTAIAASVSITLAVALGAALPALGIAAIGAGTTSAWIMRTIGGVGAGYAAKKRMEAGFLESKKKEIEERVKRKIENLKNETDEDWKKMVEGMQLETTIEGKEQDFADVDARHKRMAYLIGGGTIVASALASHFIMPHARGLFGQAWEKVTYLFGGTKAAGFYDAAHSLITGAEIQPKTGGAVVPEQIGKPFLGDTHTIKSGENVWKVTRDMLIEHHDKYGYSDDQAQKLFDSFKNQGILRRLGIRGVENFNDLTADQKHKIWAEGKMPRIIEWYKLHHGGKITDLVHAGDQVTLDDKGRIFLGDTSGMKMGYLHHDIPQGHGAGKAAESYGGRGAVDTSQFDQQIEAARARGAAAETWRQDEVARLGAEAQALNEQAIAGITDANARLWNSWLEGLGGFQLDTPAHQIQEAIGRHTPGVIGDMPMIPTPDELAQTGKAISFTQETFEKFPPLNVRETMQQYLERMSRTNFNLFKALSIIHKL